MLNLKADGESVAVEPEGNAWSLDELNKLVGGYVEIAGGCKVGGLDCVVVVNEDGRLLGLPVNEAASQLMGMPIVGDVAVIERRLLE